MAHQFNLQKLQLMITDEGLREAAARMERAAETINRAAQQIDDAINRFTPLLGDGYGNVLSRIASCLEEQGMDGRSTADGT